MTTQTIALALILTTLSLSHSSNAQKSDSASKKSQNTKAIKVGESFVIESKAIGEKRKINIYLPASYTKDAQKKFPVVYLLDGGMHEDFHHQTGLVQFLSMYQLMPESIVVGIPNTDRKRDFTHPSNDAREKTALPTSGGSKKFIQFIRDELQPHVSKHYRVGTERTVIGQSLGGLLATEILIKQPQMFDNYIIVSPSLYWSKEKLIGQLDEFLQKNKKLEKKIFLGIGEEHPVMQKVMNRFVDGLKCYAPQTVKWEYKKFSQETHATIMHRATYRAYEFLYGDKFKGL